MNNQGITKESILKDFVCGFSTIENVEKLQTYFTMLSNKTPRNIYEGNECVFNMAQSAIDSLKEIFSAEN